MFQGAGERARADRKFIGPGLRRVRAPVAPGPDGWRESVEHLENFQHSRGARREQAFGEQAPTERRAIDGLAGDGCLEHAPRQRVPVQAVVAIERFGIGQSLAWFGQAQSDALGQEIFRRVAQCPHQGIARQQPGFSRWRASASRLGKTVANGGMAARGCAASGTAARQSAW